MNDIILENRNGKILVSSLDVAEKFGKRHDSILRDIDNLISDSTKVWSEMFIESSYKNERGKIYRCFDMNRDAFSLLCMGFNGKKALEWKLKYIDAFNKMEETLKSGDYLSEEEQLKLQLFSKDPLEVATAHNKLVELEVNKATAPLIPKAEFHDAVSVAENCINFGKFAASFQNNNKVSFGRNKILDWCKKVTIYVQATI